MAEISGNGEGEERGYPEDAGEEDGESVSVSTNPEKPPVH